VAVAVAGGWAELWAVGWTWTRWPGDVEEHLTDLAAAADRVQRATGQPTGTGTAVPKRPAA
jgi:hypothetical protein